MMLVEAVASRVVALEARLERHVEDVRGTDDKLGRCVLELKPECELLGAFEGLGPRPTGREKWPGGHGRR